MTLETRNLDSLLDIPNSQVPIFSAPGCSIAVGEERNSLNTMRFGVITLGGPLDFSLAGSPIPQDSVESSNAYHPAIR